MSLEENIGNIVAEDPANSETEPSDENVEPEISVQKRFRSSLKKGILDFGSKVGLTALMGTLLPATYGATNYILETKNMYFDHDLWSDPSIYTLSVVGAGALLKSCFILKGTQYLYELTQVRKNIRTVTTYDEKTREICQWTPTVIPFKRKQKTLSIDSVNICIDNDSVVLLVTGRKTKGRKQKITREYTIPYQSNPKKTADYFKNIPDLQEHI